MWLVVCLFVCFLVGLFGLLLKSLLQLSRSPGQTEVFVEVFIETIVFNIILYFNENLLIDKSLWSIDRWIHWVIKWMTDWSVDWLIDWLIDRFDWLIDWLIDRLICTLIYALLCWQLILKTYSFHNSRFFFAFFCSLRFQIRWNNAS